MHKKGSQFIPETILAIKCIQRKNTDKQNIANNQNPGQPEENVFFHINLSYF